MRAVDQDDLIETCKVMFAGFMAALMMIAPFVAQHFYKDWPWANSFPIGWLGMCLSYMVIFFHELGHAVIGWFYGYVALPSFDFQEGGGVTYSITGQLLSLQLLLYAGLGYVAYQCRDRKGVQLVCALIALFHLATAHWNFQEVFCTFAGPLGPIVIAGFLLTRAWLDLAPRGIAERFLNAAFGFGMAFETIATDWPLLHDNIARKADFAGKTHIMGDFATITSISNFDYSTFVWAAILFAFAAMILPIVFYFNQNAFFGFFEALFAKNDEDL